MPLVMIAGHEGQQMAFDDETLQQQLDFRGIYLLWQKLTFLFEKTKNLPLALAKLISKSLIFLVRAASYKVFVSVASNC